MHKRSAIRHLRIDWFHYGMSMLDATVLAATPPDTRHVAIRLRRSFRLFALYERFHFR